MERRDFLKSAAICSVATTLAPVLAQEQPASTKETILMSQIPLN